MCGIIGIFRTGANSTPISHALIESMRDCMEHRGPDDAGIYVSSKQEIGLGHRRLSIIDLSTVASQPMGTEDDALWIVFNGEIYNHAEIRKDLEQAGVVFKTNHSDTEVILRGYQHWGEEVLPRLRGMFAFVIWDKKKQKLWMVRDRMGVKPLYYAQVPGFVIFASEIKSLLLYPGMKRAVNDRAFYDYLTFVVAPPPQTLFEGVRKLPCSHTMTFYADGRSETKRYWNPFLGAAARKPMSEDEWIEAVIAKLRESIRYRMVSDVKVGAFLSGGVDSSTNVALMSEIMDRPVETFSIAFEGQKSFNELHYARQVVERYKTNHHEYTLTPRDFMGFLPSLIKHQDEPIADPVCVPIYFLSKLAKQNDTTVCLVGEGADELLCGYPYWGKLLTLQKQLEWYGALPDAIHRFMANFYLNSPIIPWKHMRRAEVLRRVSAKEPFFWGSESYQETTKQRIMSKSYLARLNGYTSLEPIMQFRADFEKDMPGGDELQWMAYLDLRFRLPELILMRVDKMTMAASLEGRVPFLDQEFVLLCMAMPSKIKLKNGMMKYILKKAVEPLLPKEVIYRPKQGFAVPLDGWLKKDLRDWTHSKIMSFVDRTDFFDKKIVADFLNKTKGMQNWYLLNLALWHEMWIEQKELDMPSISN